MVTRVVVAMVVVVDPSEISSAGYQLDLTETQPGKVGHRGTQGDTGGHRGAQEDTVGHMGTQRTQGTTTDENSRNSIQEPWVPLTIKRSCS